MGKTVELLLKEALQLSDSERVQLVEELLTTLEIEKDDNVDEAWAREVEKRAVELSSRTVVPIIWDEVKEKAFRLVHGKD
jgi:putative addiction module component (TIGR02574 family)